MSQPIRLLTLNVFLRPPPIKTNEDDYKEERFQQILKIIDGYDIVCFEEMFQTATFRPERIIQAAIKKKFFYWKVSEPPSFLPGPVVDSGLMVLSRFPIVFSHFESYNLGILSDSASDKGYIYCKIKAREETIHLFVTHLQASYKVVGKELERELSVKTRLHQLDVLVQKIKGHLRKSEYKPEQLVLLAGDLNIDSNQRPYSMSQDSCLKKLPKVERAKRDSLEESLHDLSEHEEFIEFDQVMHIFSRHEVEVTDHAKQKFKGHPITFGDGDTILTGKQDQTSRQCLDYIFTLRFPDQSDTRLKCKTETCKVEPFKRAETKFGQLSDHYGVSISIE